MTRTQKLRWRVTGPGLDPEPSYESPGVALSRAITAAERSESEGTWYVRDLDDTIYGYAERDNDGVTRIVRRAATR